MAPKAAEGPTESQQGVVLSYSGRDDPGRSWSLGGPSAEVATCGAEETLQRRTRRTHCGRPCDNLGAMGYYHPRSRFGFVSVVWVMGHRRGR